jgi:RhtB (resistance to homoserine/threonine) family protein
MDASIFSSIALISLLGAISPGPDFAIVVKNCLSGNFRTGFLTALGVASALVVHVTYCVFGIAVLIAESPLLFHSLQYFGAAYLLYLGIQLLREKSKDMPKDPQHHAPQVKKRSKNAFLSGFLCNLLNPKATLFVLSLFTQFISPDMSLWEKALAASLLPLTGLAWFTLLSYLITHRMLQKHFSRFQFAITKIMGIVLCALAFYLIFTSMKP